jgi:hypothetical protein
VDPRWALTGVELGNDVLEIDVRVNEFGWAGHARKS